MEAEDRPRSPVGAVGAVGRHEDPVGGTPAPENAQPVTDGEAPRERCAHHPGRPAVARCETCDEPVCLACAIPVRGRVLGPGCIAEELGDPALIEPPETETERPWDAVAGAVLAAIGTVGPWTRTGAGDRIFGAWVPDVRWSTIAAITTVALIPATWLAATAAIARRLAAALAAVAAVAAALAIVFPPPFQAASWGPWVTAAGGVIATLGVLRAERRERRRTQGV